MYTNPSISQDDAKNYVPMEIVAYYLATSAIEVTVSSLLSVFSCPRVGFYRSLPANERRTKCARVSVLVTS